MLPRENVFSRNLKQGSFWRDDSTNAVADDVQRRSNHNSRRGLAQAADLEMLPRENVFSRNLKEGSFWRHTSADAVTDSASRQNLHMSRRSLAQAADPVPASPAPTIQDRMAYGSDVDPGQYPFAVRIDSTLLCSGSLIHPRVVLTAAHCVTDPVGNWMPVDFIQVKVGDATTDTPVQVRANLMI